MLNSSVLKIKFTIAENQKTPKNQQAESMGNFYPGRNLRVWGTVNLISIILKYRKNKYGELDSKQ